MSTSTLPWSSKNIVAMFRHISLPQPIINNLPLDFDTLLLRIFVNPPSKRPSISELSRIKRLNRPRSDSFPVSSQSPDDPISDKHHIRHKSWILSPGLPIVKTESGRTSNCHIRRRFLIKDKQNFYKEVQEP